LYPTPEHGIEDLRFGENGMDLLARARGAAVEIWASARKAFTLVVEGRFGERRFAVPPGIHRFVLPGAPTDPRASVD